MSLFRVCAQTLPKPASLRTLSTTLRTFTTEVKAPEQSRSKDASDIVPVPTKDVLTADIVSGAPAELRNRAVRIYKPTRNTMQSGGAKTEKWRIDFDILSGGARWENPLMGWASSSKEDAVHFAEKQGWDYYVQPPTVKRIPPKNYAENYVYKPHKLRIARTK